MKTREGLLDYVAGIEGHDLSLALAVRELLRLADAEGRVDRRRWFAAVREAHGDDGAEPWGTPEPGELDAVARYLEEQVIGRLEEDGVARREPGVEEWSTLRLREELWASVAPLRDPVLEEVDRTIESLRARSDRGWEPDGLVREGPGSRLRAEGLTKIYRRRKVVDDVEIAVRQGEIVGLLGPNGAGKTTTFYMIVGLVPPNEGRVYLDDEEITGVPMFRRSRMGIGYLAQEPSVFRKLTVEENVLAILQTLGLPKEEEKERLEELLQELSIAHLRDATAYSLSGGERRRLEITRALVQRPKFMLLDEPFAGIDPIAVNDIQQIVAELKHRGIGVIISDHNVEQTLEIVDRAYIMYEGRIRISGSVSELVWNEEVAEIYLGPILTERMRNRFPRPEGRG
ncbi:MAG TPA: LPS export ABC transporter ATP-binding protein, partial [Longimicrobiales bacterium]|nr:LPS export ABC transporter ATP-binding protein [Longimicrobiales bacterium]